eukprot:g44049.t1
MPDGRPGSRVYQEEKWSTTVKDSTITYRVRKSYSTQDLLHNVPAAISHLATVGAPTDDVTSSDAGYATSGTANTIDTASDATASVSEANTTDIEVTPAAAATNIQDLPTDSAPPTANATLPTTDADVAPPTTSTASSSRGDSSTQPCRVFTIPPDLQDE